MKAFKINKKGFSLLELLLVLSIIASLIVAAFLFYKKVDTSNKIEKERNNISLIVSATKSLFAGKVDYEGWSLKTLDNANLLADNFIYNKATNDDFGQYRDAWGNEVNTGTITPGNGSVKIAGVSLEYVIPSEACVKFVSSVFPLMDRIDVNYSNIKDTAVSYIDATKIDVSAISTSCGNSSYGDLSTVSLTFY